MTLPIKRVTLYKHGLGFFERSGQANASFALEFDAKAMDDALKSLAVLPDNAQVLGVAFETPPNRNQNAQRQPLELSPPVSGLLKAFAGAKASVYIGEVVKTGNIIGLETESEHHLERALLAFSTAQGIELIPLSHIGRVVLEDERAQSDLEFALTSLRRDTSRATARVTLSAPSAVDVSYIAPAPAWRVSYRLLAREVENDPEARDIFVQGWGLFDNTLEEDLEAVQLTLTAGMPVSFRYELHTPNTPERPLVRDESRTVQAPIEFAAMMEVEQDMAPGMSPMMAAPAPAMSKRSAKRLEAAYQESAPAQASTESKGALFAYKIATPVTVKRGESGMVPILGFKARGSRELLYNPHKTGENPTASLRFKNQNITLERGPCVILDNADYAGEAVVPFSPSGADVILAFALELGIKITTQTQTRETTTQVRFLDGSMFLELSEELETTYEATSNLEKDALITLEHPRWHNATLQREALEQTNEFARFKFMAVAQKRSELRLLETRQTSRYQEIRGLQGYQIADYLAQHLLSQASAQTLNSILERQAKIANLRQELHQNEIERGKVRARMDDTRKNLEPLTRPEDGKLRGRLVRQLEGLENAMQALEQRDLQIQKEQQNLEQEIAEQIVRLK